MNEPEQWRRAAVIAGVLGDRFSKEYLLSPIYFARAVVIALFVLFPISPASILLFAAAMDLLWLSTVPLTSALVAQMFGIRYLSTLLGVMFSATSLAASPAPGLAASCSS